MNLALRTRRECSEALEARAFQRSEDGTFARNGVLARPGLRWLSFESRVGRTSCASDTLDPLVARLPRRGLWKLTAAAPDAVPRWEFHLPLAVFDANGSDVELDHTDDVNPLQASIEWAFTTAEGGLPSGWEPPPRRDVEGWIREGGLSAQIGPFVRQGSLVQKSDCLALTFPLVHAMPPSLSEARRDWLRAALVDAHNRWHMVRIVVHGHDRRPAVEALVDLSGAPHTILEELFKISLDSLRWVVQQVLWPVGFLSDPSVTCDAWDISPTEFFEKEETNDE